MAETKIEWADYTFNSWMGCQKVSPACDHCYAEGWAKRSGLVKWGPGEQRRRTSASYWQQPVKWNRVAERDGVRRKVFCCSLADVFDNAVDQAWRADLFRLILATPNLDWLLLTKRPQMIRKMLPADWGKGYSNVWLGTTVENQEEADRRIPHLLDVPAAKRFLSCEPLLEPLDLESIPFGKGNLSVLRTWTGDPSVPNDSIGWVIAGGESGSGARLMHPDWARSLRDQCQSAGVAFFLKQMTKKAPIPDDLLVREFPT